jgi:hypothetical protein
MPKFYPPGSLSEHCITHHGFPPGQTVIDPQHASGHANHDRAVASLHDDGAGPWCRVGDLLPVGHPYEPLTDSPA